MRPASLLFMIGLAIALAGRWRGGLAGHDRPAIGCAHLHIGEVAIGHFGAAIFDPDADLLRQIGPIGAGSGPRLPRSMTARRRLGKAGGCSGECRNGCGKSQNRLHVRNPWLNVRLGERRPSGHRTPIDSAKV